MRWSSTRASTPGKSLLPKAIPAYPYVGIWKADPEDSFGVIIEKAENAM